MHAYNVLLMTRTLSFANQANLESEIMAAAEEVLLERDEEK